MAAKVSLINMKGGVGKSTLAIGLTWYFAWHKEKNVLLVDLDPQFNATQYTIGVKQFSNLLKANQPTIWDVFEQFSQYPGAKPKGSMQASDVILNHRAWKPSGIIDLVPSRLELAYSLRNPAQKEDLLRRFIDQVEQDYDLIIYDCPPTESLLTTAAYLASDYILVPVKPEYLSSIGLPLLANSLNEFLERYSKAVSIAGIVFNATSNYYPEEAQSKKEVQKVAKQNGWYVFKNEVTYSRSYPRGAREGRPIFLTNYARYNQIQRFENVANEFAGRVGL